MTLKFRLKSAAARLPWRRKAQLPKTLYCSFCGKSQHHVEKLIAGPCVFICNECVELCVDIIKHDGVRPIEQPALIEPSEGRPITESKEDPAPETWKIGDIQSMSTERLLRWLKFQEDLFEQSRDGLQEAVDTLRQREVSWATIGEALGVSRQAAWDRFS
jgi:hypothetical protein